MVIDKKAKIREIENVVNRSYVKILGRYPDDGGKKGFINSILGGNIDLASMEHKLMQSAEFSDRLNRYCRSHGRDITTLPRGFVPPRLPGDPVLDGYDLIEGGNDVTSFNRSVVLVSTWGIKCGIATYSGYLMKELKKLGVSVDIFPINSGITNQLIPGKLLELEHEFGIMPTMVHTESNCIICWHTVPVHIVDAVRMFERSGNVVAHIVHSEEAANFIRKSVVSRDIYTIAHGSKIMPDIDKEKARMLLDLEDTYGIKDNDKFAFVFGFQAPSKNFNEMIAATRKAGIKLVISGAKHQCGYESEVVIKDNTIFLGKWLSDVEIDLWALSSDMLIFDYQKQAHYSCSGAMHRTVGAGRPVVCSRTMHFTDIKEGADCLKFDGMEELTLKIKEALMDGKSEELGKKAADYAKKTSWLEVAKKRVEIYKKYSSL